MLRHRSTLAHDLVTGTLKSRVGASFEAGMLGTRKVGANNVVLLGPQQQFNRANIDMVHF